MTTYKKRKKPINLDYYTAEYLLEALENNPALETTEQGLTQRIQDRLLVIKLRNIVNDEYWDDLGLTGTIFNINPDSITKYRKILNDADIPDHKKLQKIFSIADSKKEKDIIKPKHSSMDDENVKERRDDYWKLKRMIGRSVGVIYPNWQPMDNDKVIKFLDGIQIEIYPDYTKDKEILAELLTLVDDKIFWADKGRKDFKSGKDQHDFTPKCIYDVREILANNTISQKHKFKKIEEALKTYKVSQKDTPEVIAFMRYAPSLITNKTTKSQAEIKNLNNVRIFANHSREVTSGSIEVTAQTILNDLSPTLNDKKWKTKGESFTGTKVPDGIKKCRKILNSDETAEVKLEKIFMLVHAKTKEHKSRHKSMFSKNPDPEVQELYQAIDVLSKAWHGQINQREPTLTRAIKTFDAKYMQRLDI